MEMACHSERSEESADHFSLWAEMVGDSSLTANRLVQNDKRVLIFMYD